MVVCLARYEAHLILLSSEELDVPEPAFASRKTRHLLFDLVCLNKAGEAHASEYEYADLFRTGLISRQEFPPLALLLAVCKATIAVPFRLALITDTPI